jgi:hypothetical protein
MATINIGEIVATTLRSRRKKLADNVLNHNALFARLNQKGHVKPVGGGREIVEELEYAENGTSAWYSGYEVLDISPSEVFDAATYDWKQLAGNVTISGLEKLKNSGRERTINLLAARIKNLEKTLMNDAATAVYADGTTDTKSLGGLAQLVQDDPTSVANVGGIAQATYSFWQNQISATAATSAGNIAARLNVLWLKLLRGTDKPDFAVADDQVYNDFEASLQQYQRFSDASEAATGFESLKYKTCDVFYDDQCTADRFFFINTDYLYLRPHVDCQFHAAEERQSINQDALVQPVYWAGNITCSNRSLQVVLIKT